MSKKTLNIALMTIIVFGIVGLGYVWANYGLKPNVQDAPVLLSEKNDKVQINGRAVSEKTADLGFVISARITSLPVKVGDLVKAGQILAVQDSADIAAQAGAAQANLQASMAQLKVLNHDLKKEKLKVHDLSGDERKQQQAQVSSVKDSLDVQNNVILAASENLANVKAQMNKTVLRAPFDGIIVRQDGEIGEVGSANADSFLTVASNETIKKIEAYASDLDASKIKIGDQATVSFDIFGGQKLLSSKVVSVDTQAVDGKYKVTLILDQPDTNIKSGMHASVSF